MNEHTAENDTPVSCNWHGCNSPRTGKCFAWCKCRCHDARARRSWAEKHYAEPCDSCGAKAGQPCRTASGYVTMRHASRRSTIVGICPDCGQPVTRDQPAWGPRGGPVHHDPCPIPPAKGDS